MDCKGNCGQGDRPCEHPEKCEDGEFYGLLASLTLSILLVIGLALYAAWR